MLVTLSIAHLFSVSKKKNSPEKQQLRAHAVQQLPSEDFEAAWQMLMGSASQCSCVGGKCCHLYFTAGETEAWGR